MSPFGRGAALLAGLFLLACEQRPPAPATTPADRSADALVASRGGLEDRVLLTGELEAVHSDNLAVPRSPVWVLSLRWLIADGTWVKKGEPVIEFDSTSLSSGLEDKRTAVVRTENELTSEAAKSAGAIAEKAVEVERKRAALEKAEVDADVPADLRSRREHQEKQLALAQARDALVKAEEDLTTTKRSGQLDQTVKEVARSRAARELADLMKQMDDLTLRAPRDGMVQLGSNGEEGRKYVIGDQVYPGWVVASLPDLSAMQVRSRLYDVDDGTVKEGMAADCILDAYPQKVFTGRVQKLSPMARPESRDASRRFFDVVIALQGQAEAILRPGMSVRVEVIRRRVTDALIVPRAALRSSSSGAQVRLISGQDQAVEVEWCTELACVLRGGILDGTRLLPQVPVGQAAP